MNTSWGDLSVILVSFNSAHVLADTLNSISQYLGGAEVIVVENGLDDPLSDKQKRDAVQVVRGHGNIGFGAGNNAGARIATRPYLLFLNPDAKITGTDHARFERTAQLESFGILSCSIQDLSGQISAAGALRRDLPWPLELTYCITRNFLTSRRFRLPTPTTREPRRGWVSGAGLTVSAKEFEALGGFDEDFFLYYEDRDLSRRYVRAGLPLRAAGGIAVTHHGGASAPQPSDTQIALGLLGFLHYTAKWNGSTSARRAGRATLLLLRLVGLAFCALGVRTRSEKLQRKGYLAAAVRMKLRNPAWLPRVDSYPLARAALRHLAR